MSLGTNAWSAAEPHTAIIYMRGGVADDNTPCEVCGAILIAHSAVALYTSWPRERTGW